MSAPPSPEGVDRPACANPAIFHHLELIPALACKACLPEEGGDSRSQAAGSSRSQARCAFRSGSKAAKTRLAARLPGGHAFTQIFGGIGTVQVLPQ